MCGNGQGDDKHRMCLGKLIARNVFSKIDIKEKKRGWSMVTWKKLLGPGNVF